MTLKTNHPIPIMDVFDRDDGQYIPESERARCFICNHLIKDSTPNEGFAVYDVAIHQDCHDNITYFERIRRNGGMKGLVPAPSHIPDAPPQHAQNQPEQPDELRESLAWAERVREKAERQIAKVARTIPTGVMHRLNHLRDAKPAGLSDRQYELIQMWNGVGAMVLEHPSSVDDHAITAAMDGLSKLPTLKEYVKEWWLFHADYHNDHKLQLNFSSIKPGFYTPHSESGILLSDALSIALRSILPDIPGPTSIYVLLGNKEGKKPESDRRRITLSEITDISNALERRRASVLNKGTVRHYSVPEVHDILTDAGLKNFVVDCGLSRGDAEFKQLESEYGDGVRRCEKCPNWFLLDANQVDVAVPYTTCRGCTVTDKPELPPDTPVQMPDRQRGDLTFQATLF